MACAGGCSQTPSDSPALERWSAPSQKYTLKLVWNTAPIPRQCRATPARQRATRKRTPRKGALPKQSPTPDTLVAPPEDRARSGSGESHLLEARLRRVELLPVAWLKRRVVGMEDADGTGDHRILPRTLGKSHSAPEGSALDAGFRVLRDQRLQDVSKPVADLVEIFSNLPPP